MSDLKKCPFCGGIAVIYELNNGWYAECNDSDCSHQPQQQLATHKKEDAIKIWNTRISNEVEEDAKKIQSLETEIESYKLTLRANGVAPMLLDQAE